MKKDDMESVFGASAGADLDLDDPLAEPEEDDSAETEDALDMAIDEAFEATDPLARREAFKTAIRLCKDESY